MNKNQAAVILGKVGGSSKSPAKRAASAVNGKLGGRPRTGTVRWMNPATGSVDTAEGWKSDCEAAKKAGEPWGEAWDSGLIEVVYDGHKWKENA